MDKKQNSGSEIKAGQGIAENFKIRPEVIKGKAYEGGEQCRVWGSS